LNKRHLDQPAAPTALRAAGILPKKIARQIGTPPDDEWGQRYGNPTLAPPAMPPEPVWFMAIEFTQCRDWRTRLAHISIILVARLILTPTAMSEQFSE
jgi:hypothetical protein